MVSVGLEGVTKRYNNVVAVDNVDIEVREGEIFTLLGPSGCGKTTTLRIIAGFEKPDSGRIYFGDEDVTDMKPHLRGTAMVFQNYALWPHMTVFDNVAYGLKLRKVPKNEIRKRVRRALELVGLEGLEDRYPLQLSGGQQQRVALARAIVVEPRVLLLDEPLSNLDATLRLRMREEIVSLQRRLGITTIYVTHDQEEAMSISDRIAVMNRGRVLQIDTPHGIYRRPRSLFVATFIGRSTVLRGVVSRTVDSLYELDIRGLRILGENMSTGELSPGEEAVAVIRPEDFTLVEEGGDVNVIEGIVEIVMFLGVFNQVRLKTPAGSVSVYLSPKHRVEQGKPLRVYVNPEDVKIYSVGEAGELEL